MTRSDSNHPVEALSAYLDGELSPSEAAELEMHLRDCRECGLALEDLRLLSRAVAGEELPPLPADLAGRITRRLEPDRPGKSAPRAGWLTGFFGAPLAAAAAAVLAVGVLWVVWQGSQMTMMSPPPEVAELDAVEQEERAESRFAPDADKKAAMADAALGADAAPPDDTDDRRDLPAKRKPSPKGPAPSTLDRDVRADLATPGESLEGDREGAAGYAPSPPMEPRTVPPATVAKVAPTELMKDEEAGRLHELGDVSSAEAEPEAAVPEMIGEEQKVEVRDGLAYVTPGKGAVPPTEAAQSSPQMREKRARRAAPLAADTAAQNEAERDLVLREPGYEIRLTPSGEMTVSAGEYACTVSPDEITPSVAGEVMAEDAAAADQFDPYTGKESPAQDVARPGFEDTAVAGSDPDRALLLGLVRGPYREALERKCGPLPEPLAGDPEP